MKLKKYIVVFLAVLFMLSATGCKQTSEKKNNTKQTNAASQNKTPTQSTTKPSGNSGNNNHITTPSENTQPTENTDIPEPSESVSLCEHVVNENWEVVKSATCTTEGSRRRTCSICQEVVEEEPIPKLDHVKGSWVVEKTATCKDDGRQSQSCLQCKTKLLIANIAKLAHKPDITGKRCSVCFEFIEENS